MRLSYRWLTRLLGREYPLRDIVERLTNNGLEVEAVYDCGLESGKVVAGRILEKIPHPNAESLTLCQVDVGGERPLRIVCGAKNMKPGDVVPVAIEGARLPNGMVIKHSKIRGEASEGMMCSGRELGWSEDHDGLLILPQDRYSYELGKPFDALIEIKVTPNRPDCLSVLGLVRDLAAGFGLDPTNYPASEISETGAPAADSAKVRVEAVNECPRYTGRVIRNVSIGPSPLWLSRAVESAGLRSINNVVDVTNYILMELGHPIHSFDLDRVARGEIIVRLAREGEEIQTLDGQTATLTASDLLIADPEKPIALAGIMGCGNSEIVDSTRNVFLECAYFDPGTIRRTSKRLAKSTDSSYRFERGTDWQNLLRVLDRATQLIVEVAGGEVASGKFDEGKTIIPPSPIELSVARTNSLLGFDVGGGEITHTLRLLGFAVKENDADSLVVTPPAFRPDVSCDADLIEEVARILGYDRIPVVMPRITSRAVALSSQSQAIATARRVLAASGFQECLNYSFQAEELFVRCGLDLSSAERLQNPLSAEYAVMRTHLLPGILATVAYNQNHGQPDVRLFEIGNAYEGPSGGKGEPVETLQFVAVLSGADESTWRQQGRATDFHDMKSAASALVAEMGATGATVVRPEASSVPMLHPGKAALLQVGGATICTIGELHPEVRERMDLRRNATVMYGVISSLASLLDAKPQYREIPVFPAASRDLALVVEKEVASADIEAVIAKRAKTMLNSIKLFDVYEGEHVAAGKKSLAYQLRYSAPDRTLTDEEVNKLQAQILGDLKAKLGAELRG